MAPFKVAIVGGGMTGLTAALHLDRIGMDFVLLEAYSEITPEVGASLALYPNFQRVLDQLGVLDEVHKESSELRTLSCRRLDGKQMFMHTVAESIHAATGGYGISTFTRSQLLRILYRNISEEGKKKIFTNKRVSRIEQLAGDEGVRLHLEDGESYDADVVIGADGVHSTVRSEMWRMAKEVDPNAFKGDQAEDIPTEFGCAFGLSTHTGDLRKDYGYQISDQDMTIGLFGGPEGEALWFIFFKVGKDKPRRGELPKWTAEEGEAICRKFAGAKFTETTTFGDVYANKYRVTTQACPNHCLRKWNSGRIICLGDSVAKTNPILAQGGAQGAESVFMLVDRLDEACKKHAQKQKKQDADAAGAESTSEEAGRLPTAEVERILAGVSTERFPRVSSLVDKSQQVMRISAWDGWLFRFIGKYVTGLLPTWVIVGQALGPWNGAYLSKTLPVTTTKTTSDSTAKPAATATVSETS